MIDPGLLLFAFALGLGTFFSPCSVALLPAYVGYFVGLDPTGTPTGTTHRTTIPPPDPAVRFRNGVRFGLAAAGGILGIFALFGGLIYLLRTTVHLPSTVLATGLTVVAIGVAVIVILLGILMLTGRAPAWTPRIKAPTRRTVPAMALFGGLYAFASLGCTLPLFFAVLAQVILVGPLGGVLLISAFAIGFAGLMFVATVALTLAQARARKALTRILPHVKAISGVVLILAGGYILYYYLIKTPPV